MQVSDCAALPVRATSFWSSDRMITDGASTDTLIGALSQRPEVKNLTCVSNNAGVGKFGLGMSI